ncbi:MAG: phosphate ABC transporter substrate-binding protein [Nitrosomonadales bacterium]|nr:phosphate ABC transporter substrate-binding protein [Nitrosomonadales bacterium]
MKRTMSLKNCVHLIVIGLALSLRAGAAVAEVVAVVSARNPVTATLSNNQVVDIFLGKASRFPDGSQAVPIDQSEGSAVRDEFYLKFTGKSPAQIKAHWSKIIFTGRGRPPREVTNSIEVKKLLAKDPNAIGYIEQSLVDSSVKVLLAQ